MNEHEEEIINSVLSRYPGLKLAMVFGSMAQGNERPDSDLDLAVLYGKPLDAALKMSIIGELALAVSRPIDLIDLKTIGEPLLGQVLKGKRIYGTATEHGQLMARHLKDVADFLPYRNRILKARRDRWINK